MPGPGSRISIWAPQRIQRMWISVSLMGLDLSAEQESPPHSRPSARAGSCEFDYDFPVIPAIVLAAGRSSRMGRAKATLPLDGGDTFLTRIVRTFRDAGVDDVIVVVGHGAEAVAAAFATSGLPARFVVNPDYDRGQLSSLIAGLAVIDRPGVTAVLVTLVDVPLVSAATVRAVIERYRSSGAPVVRPTSGSRHGHPLLIDRSLFEGLRRADPLAGAKAVVRAHASPAGDLAIDDEGAFTDIDTEEEYKRWVTDRSGGAAGGRWPSRR
jgi:molybdenum cofactor cytidylyltransferase